MPKDKGGDSSLYNKDSRRSQASTGVNKYNKDDRSKPTTDHQNLKDLGITKDQSSQCQKIANMPETV